MEGFELSQIFRLIAALAFVVALMGGLALILKKLGYANIHAKAKNARRLKIIETLPLDARRRLALIQRDDVQHLVILGGTHETVIETGIKPVQTDGDDS